MNEREMVDHLDSLALQVPVVSEHVDEVITNGRRELRRRRFAAVAASAAAVVALGGVASTLGTNSSQGDGDVIASDGTQSGTASDMKFVGMRTLVTQVPSDWAIEQFACSTPNRDFVSFYTGVGYNCFAQPAADGASGAGVAHLQFEPIDSPPGKIATESSTVSPTAGDPAIAHSLPVCHRGDDYCTLYVVAPEVGVALTITVPRSREDEGTAIVESSEFLAADMTTVPFVEPGTTLADARSMLAAAGLSMSPGPASDDENDIVESATDPVAGTPVPTDSVVRVTALDVETSTGPTIREERE
jgi:hypothetical protein